MDCVAVIANQLAPQWRLPKSQVLDALKNALTEYGTEEVAIVFILAKDVLAKDTEAKRAETINSLLEPKDPRWFAHREYLDDLVHQPVETTFETTPEEWRSFEEFLAACSAWTGDDVYIYHLKKRVTLVQRRLRIKGMCYISAPIMLQHYLVAIHQPDVGMIDMRALILQHFDGEELRKNIFDHDNCSSLELLRKILLPGSNIFPCHPDGYEAFLVRFGPGLVSNFSVHADFYAANAVSFDGEPSGPFIGRHAMVLLGARRDTKGKRWFLLQNCWTTSQFVEVSAEYMGHCKPTVYFV